MGIVRIFGLALSCVGIVLLICGYNATVAEGDVIVNRFTELFSDSTMWYITGCIAIACGIGIFRWGALRPDTSYREATVPGNADGKPTFPKS